MVLEFYKIPRQPFGVTPEPSFLLMSNTHREALASLIYGLHEERGFLALAAPPGMGKTTLLFYLLEHLRGRARTAFLCHTQCDPLDFFRYVIRDFGISPGPDLPAIHDQLNQVILAEARGGRSVVLIIDEAQGLSPAVLEAVRLLSNFENPGRKLLQIVIAGQIGLIETLIRQDMEQLRQRIAIVASLKPFNTIEVSDYISHRLRLAGRVGSSLFTPEAIKLVARSSEGIPRNINHICFNALSIGYALKREAIGANIIEEVVADRSIESLLAKSDVLADRSPDAFNLADHRPTRFPTPHIVPFETTAEFAGNTNYPESVLGGKE